MPSLVATMRPTSADTRLASKSFNRSLMTSEISLVLMPTRPFSYEASARRRRSCCNLVATLASTSRSPYWSFNPPRMPGSTTTLILTSLPSRFDSSRETRSRSCGSSSTAVVTVARTRPAASSASASNASTTPPISRTRSLSIKRRARLVASGWSPPREVSSSVRRSLEIVGFARTSATSGFDMSSPSAASCSCHSSTRFSSVASSKTARAYLLAAAVATRHLRDRPLDQLLVLLVVERLTDDLLRRLDHEPGDLGADRLDGLVALRLDLLGRRLADALRLLFGLGLQLGAQLLRRLAGRVDHALRGLARVLELRPCLFELLLSLGARLLRLPQLLGDRTLPGLRLPHDHRVDPAGEHGQHDHERDQLDPDRAVDVDDARGSGGDEEHPLWTW